MCAAQCDDQRHRLQRIEPPQDAFIGKNDDPHDMTFIKLNAILVGVYFFVWLVGDVTHVSMGQPRGSLAQIVVACVILTSPVVAALLNWKCLRDTSIDRRHAAVFGLLVVPFAVFLLMLTLGIWFHVSIGGVF